MDELTRQVNDLNGALNLILAQLRELDNRLKSVETSNQSEPSISPNSLCEPRTEADLKDISRLPDCVKELQAFDGNPTQYVSWIHNVESILKDFSIIKSKPMYRAILRHIRQKIRGGADSALISYNIFDDDWEEIKRILSLHYADKRDIRTLEHQLNQLTQKGTRLDEFYATVNHQFSLIINKIKTESYTQETVSALVETYRNRALDVFIRGLNGDLSRMLIVQRPKTLPEAYASCLEMQNLNFRNHTIHIPNPSNMVTAPLNQSFRIDNRPIPPHRFIPKPSYLPNVSNQYHSSQPPRPIGPKPHPKMEVDHSVQTKQVNYINRPQVNPFKKRARSENHSRYQNMGPKQQRLYNLQPVEEIPLETYSQVVSENYEDEVNFMMDACPAYHT